MQQRMAYILNDIRRVAEVGGDEAVEEAVEDRPRR